MKKRKMMTFVAGSPMKGPIKQTKHKKNPTGKSGSIGKK